MPGKFNRITPHLWFDDRAEEAARFYASVFRNSRIRQITRYGEAGAGVSGRTAGSVMTVAFELDGRPFLALNGGPVFSFTPAVSFVVSCRNQKEVDYFWERLSEGGKPGRCGWLEDRYGVSWQIVPDGLSRLLETGGPERSERVMAALLQMDKINLAGLEAAFGPPPRRAGIRKTKAAPGPKSKQ